MKYYDIKYRYDLFLKLAENRNTGTPRELAKRLKISERQLRRMRDNFHDQGIVICYCRFAKTYYIENVKNIEWF
jgi:predicted DNA-binding transcriptional regulator YafY